MSVNGLFKLIANMQKQTKLAANASIIAALPQIVGEKTEEDCIFLQSLSLPFFVY